MTTEFGWWARDADGRKSQIRAKIFGGQIAWARKCGHHQPWQTYDSPTDEDWTKLVIEAERRVPRRLLSSKQFEAIKRLRPR